MREEIAVWAEIRLLHFLGRKWIRSGESCSLLLPPKNATRLAFNPFSQTSAQTKAALGSSEEYVGDGEPGMSL